MGKGLGHIQSDPNPHRIPTHDPSPSVLVQTHLLRVPTCAISFRSTLDHSVGVTRPEGEEMAELMP